MAERRNRALTIVITAAIVAAFAEVDYATPQILRSSVSDDFRWLFFAAIGVCISQVTLIALWAVFAPGNIVVRLPWALLFGLGMWYLLLLGMWHIDRGHDRSPTLNPRDTFVLGEILLAGVTVLQIPLWIGKRAFRFRLIRTGEEPTPIADERFQFNLQHLLIGTFIFAVALSPIRYVLPKEPVGQLSPGPELLLLIPIAIVADLVATLPCFWVGFRRRVWALIAGWFVYELIIAGIEHAIVHTFDHAPWEAKVYAMLAALNLSQAAVVFAVARVYYALGYRLQRVPRHSLQNEEHPPE